MAIIDDSKYKLPNLGIANPGTPVKIPTAAQLTDKNIAGLTTGSGSLKMPKLSVYTPDYAGLQASFNQLMSGYDQLGQAAQASAEAQKSALQSSLEQQMKSIDTTRTENRQTAAENRAQIQSDAYMQQRATSRAASARGLGGSGVEALAQIQNRMATGEAISNMSNEYFDAQQQLVEAEAAARTNFDNANQQLSASLQSTMAQIMSQKASTSMDYQQTIDTLKRQVIADQNAVAQAQYEWQYAQQQLEQGAQITDSMIYDGLQQRVGDLGSQIAFLTTLGMTPREANLKALQFNNQQASQSQTQIQNYIDARRSQDSTLKEADLRTEIMQMFPSANFTGLNFSGTGTTNTITKPSSTSKSTYTPIGSTASSTPTTGMASALPSWSSNIATSNTGATTSPSMIGAIANYASGTETNVASQIGNWVSSVIAEQQSTPYYKSTRGNMTAWTVNPQYKGPAISLDDYLASIGETK